MARPAPDPYLDVHAVNALLDPWLAGRVVERVERMEGGLVNRNYHLRLRGRPADAVLRFYDRDPSACGRELAVLGLLGRELPVPRALYIDDEHEPPLVVMSIVEGIALQTLRAFNDETALAEAAFDAGRVLAQLRHFPGPPTPAVSTADLVARFTREPTFVERAGVPVADAVAEFARRAQPRLDLLPRGGSLVHGDYNARNVFVRQTADGWRVSGILDWEFALDASPFIDVGNLLRYHTDEQPRFEPHFSAGLRAGGMELPEDWLTVARLMDLPALCEMLSRPALPADLVPELVELIQRTLRLPLD